MAQPAWTFLVKVTPRAGSEILSKRYVQDYVREAIEQWSGQDDPEGPTFYFCSPHHDGKVTVRPIKEKTNAR